MSNKVYVGNLPYSFAHSDLEKLFAAFGRVRLVEVVLDRETNRSRGFGFVEMESAEGVQAVIQNLHDTELQGRRLTVNPARERAGGEGGPRGYEPGARSDGGHSRGHSGAPRTRPAFGRPQSIAVWGGGARAPGSHRPGPRGGESSHRGGGRPKRDGEGRWSDGGRRRRRRDDDFGDE